jgi:hypothetical protein
LQPGSIFGLVESTLFLFRTLMVIKYVDGIS